MWQRLSTRQFFTLFPGDKMSEEMKGLASVEGTAPGGMTDRKAYQVSAKVAEVVTRNLLWGFVLDRIEPAIEAYTDDSSSLVSLQNRESVRHSRLVYASGGGHTHGVDSF